MIVDTPGQLIARHETAIIGLRELQRLPHPTLTAMPQYDGMTEADAIAHLREVKFDLDERYVLAVFASIEAALKSDARWRVNKGKKSRVNKAIRDAVEHATWERFRLEDLLRSWRDLVVDRRPLSELIRISHRRHWLAHGKYFRDRSGVGEIEPADVLFWWEQAEAAARGIAPDFPRDDLGI